MRRFCLSSARLISVFLYDNSFCGGGHRAAQCRSDGAAGRRRREAQRGKARRDKTRCVSALQRQTHVHAERGAFAEHAVEEAMAVLGEHEGELLVLVCACVKLRHIACLVPAQRVS